MRSSSISARAIRTTSRLSARAKLLARLGGIGWCLLSAGAPLVAWGQGTGWTVEVVDTIGNVGFYPSIAVTSAGDPRIAYFDGTNADLKFASRSSGSWTIETVDTVGRTGEYCSLALDSADNPRISYHDQTNGDLKYASKSGGVWTIEVVDSANYTGLYTSLALTAGGMPRISYHDWTNKDLRFASKLGGVWVLGTVDTVGDVGRFASLALSSSGDPRISYLDATDETHLTLEFASRTDGVWSIETVAPAAHDDTSLELSPAGEARISYLDVTGAIRYVTQTGGVWTQWIVADSGSPFSPSLELDSGGLARICYWSWNAGLPEIKFAEEVSLPIWDRETVDSPGSGWLSLALDGDDCAHVAYQTEGSNDLKYANHDCVASPDGPLEFGDAPDGIPSCQASTDCASPPASYPTVLGSDNAPEGRDAPYHFDEDDTTIPVLGGGPTLESTAFQACCDWLSGGCDTDDGPVVLCLGGGCESGVVVTGGPPCTMRALGTFGPFPGTPTVGLWVYDVTTGPFASGSYYTNVAVDWNLSAAWGDAAGEWPVVDDSVGVGPFQTETNLSGLFPVLTTYLIDPLTGQWGILPFWTRFVVSEQKIAPDFPLGDWDGSGPGGGFAVGETEDWVPFGDPEGPCTIIPGSNLFATAATGGTYHSFNDSPIPEGFFRPGSDSFSGVVVLQGSPIETDPPGLIDPADTILQRLAPAVLPGPGGEDTVPIEIVALSLVSTNPIVVTRNGGQNPELWDVRMALSSVQPQPEGQMTIRASSCGFAQGGTFTSTLPVQPHFIFTRQNDGQIRVWDYGEEGLPPIVLNTEQGHWSMFDPGTDLVKTQAGFFVDHDGDPNSPSRQLQLGTSNFYPGVRCDACTAGACYGSVAIRRRVTTGYSQTTTQAYLPAQRSGQEAGDLDGDGLVDDVDNCPADYNPIQEDSDDDGVGDVCDNGPGTWDPCQTTTGVGDEPLIAGRPMLGVPNPNPVRDHMQYTVSLPKSGRVQVGLYGVGGQRVRELVDRDLPAGVHGFVWSSREDVGGRLPSGVFYLQLEVDGRRECRKLTLVQ